MRAPRRLELIACVLEATLEAGARSARGRKSRHALVWPNWSEDQSAKWGCNTATFFISHQPARRQQKGPSDTVPAMMFWGLLSFGLRCCRVQSQLPHTRAFLFLRTVLFPPAPSCPDCYCDLKKSPTLPSPQVAFCLSACSLPSLIVNPTVLLPQSFFFGPPSLVLRLSSGRNIVYCYHLLFA